MTEEGPFFPNKLTNFLSFFNVVLIDFFSVSFQSFSELFFENFGVETFNC
jgi:hypothetical protein